MPPTRHPDDCEAAAAAVHIGDIPGNGKAEARSTAVAATRILGAIERFEHPLQLRFRQSRPSITDRNTQRPTASLFHLGATGNAKRFVDQIHQAALQALGPRRQ